MNSSTKTLIASITNKSDRDVFRQNMIQAQLQSEVKPETKKEKQ